MTDGWEKGQKGWEKGWGGDGGIGRPGEGAHGLPGGEGEEAGRDEPSWAVSTDQRL